MYTNNNVIEHDISNDSYFCFVTDPIEIYLIV